MGSDAGRLRIQRRPFERADRWVGAHPWSVDMLVAALAAAVLGISSVVAIPDLKLSVGWSVVLVLAVVVLHGSLVARRSLPVASFAVATAVMAVVALAPDGSSASGPVPPLFLPSSLVFLLSLYAVSAYGRPAPGYALIVGLAGAGIATLRIGLVRTSPADSLPHGTIQLLFLFGALAAAVVASWSFGRFRRLHFAYVATLEERAERAEADREERARRAAVDERARIAREMHDVVAHSLSIVVSQAEGGRYAARARPDKAAAVLETIADTGRQALADMRGLLGVLNNDEQVGDGADAGWGPQPGLAQLPDLIARVRAAGLAVDHTERGTAHPLSPAGELAVFRLVQESLTNTLKHAGADAHAAVEFAWTDGDLRITAGDDGSGLISSDGSGRGLVGMRERLAVVGGSMSSGARPGGGFLIRARVPYRSGPAEEGAS
ncbi:MAG TPA: histidine kinase [Mycobacteriales bacterium]